MAYTPDSDFSFSADGYTPNSDFTFINGYAPTQATISIIGQVPSLELTVQLTPAQAELTLTGGQAKHSNFVVFITPDTGTLNVSGETPSVSLGKAITPTRGTVTESGQVPSFTNRILYAIQDFWVSTHYRCYLDDLELPIKSFQYRINTERQFGSVVIAGADDYLTEINDRADGNLKVNKIYNYADGSTQTFLMFYVALDTIRLDQGGLAGTTVTLNGSGLRHVETPQSITLQNIVSYSETNGASRRVRSEIDPRVRPADTVTANGATFTVDEVIWYIDTKTAISEIQEA
jgi:hypothetical protein